MLCPGGGIGGLPEVVLVLGVGVELLVVVVELCGQVCPGGLVWLVDRLPGSFW